MEKLTMFLFGNIRYIIYIAGISSLILILFVWYQIWKERVLSKLFPVPGRYNIIRGSLIKARVKQGLIVLSIIMFGIVMLRPQWGEQVKQVTSEGSDVLVALDVSPSMLARDIKPDRLTRAKDAIRWIVGSLKGDRVGLILFSGDAFLMCPFTNDYAAFMMFLDSASPDSIYLKGTDIGAALRDAYRVFKDKKLTSRILVLITDGEDHGGSGEEAAKLLRELDVAVYTVGIGSVSGEMIPMPVPGTDPAEVKYVRNDDGKLVISRQNIRFLKEISGYTGGHYIDISDSFSGLHFILEIISDQHRNRYGTRVIKEPREQFQIFAFLLIVFLTAELMLHERSYDTL
jgi:Ca-activated chloride channel family protein